MVVVLTKCINESTLAQHFPTKQAPIYPLLLKENSPPRPCKNNFCLKFSESCSEYTENLFKITLYLIQSLFKKPPTTNIGRVTYYVLYSN
jgi:hypothetical protein